MWRCLSFPTCIVSRQKVVVELLSNQGQVENSDNSQIILVTSHLRAHSWVGTTGLQRFQLIKTLSLVVITNNELLICLSLPAKGNYRVINSQRLMLPVIWVIFLLFMGRASGGLTRVRIIFSILPRCSATSQVRLLPAWSVMNVFSEQCVHFGSQLRRKMVFWISD